MLSKLLLVVLLFVLASKLGLKTWFRELKPKLDRVVNATLIALVIVYGGQLVLWLLERH